MKKLLFYILLGSFSLLAENGIAQKADWDGPWGVGVGFGPNSYIGDLNEHNANRFLIIPQSLSFAGHGWFSKGFGPISLILQMNLGRLQSRDYTKDQKFRASFYDYGGRLRLNMNQILLGKRYRRDKWNFYIQGGVGLMRFSSYLTDINNDDLINQVGYAAIGKAMSVVGGAGIKYYMTDEANFHIGVDYHVLNSDEVDAKAKGNSDDNYIYLNIGFSYEFGNIVSRSGSRKSLRWGRF